MAHSILTRRHFQSEPLQTRVRRPEARPRHHRLEVRPLVRRSALTLHLALTHRALTTRSEALPTIGRTLVIMISVISVL